MTTAERAAWTLAAAHLFNTYRRECEAESVELSDWDAMILWDSAVAASKPEGA